MKLFKTTLITICFGLLNSGAIAQCANVAVADSSFEEGTFDTGPYPTVKGIWYRNDGCEVIGGVAYHGDSSVCSTEGGAFQFIDVEPNTTYYLSCYILNGASDASPNFIINGTVFPIIASSDDWSLVSQSFNSGSDTTTMLEFISSEACFDLFRITCDSLTVGVRDIDKALIYSIYPSISSNRFRFETKQPATLEVFDLNGRMIERFEKIDGLIYFGEKLIPAVYILRITTANQAWSEKITKL